MVRRFKKIKQTRKRGGAASEREGRDNSKRREDTRSLNSRRANAGHHSREHTRSPNSRRANAGRQPDPTPEEKKIARDILSRTESFVTMTPDAQEYACFEYARKFIRNGKVGKLFDPRKYLSDTIYIDLAKVIFEKYGLKTHPRVIQNYAEELKKHPDIIGYWFSTIGKGGKEAFMQYKLHAEFSDKVILLPIPFVENAFNLRDFGYTVASAFKIENDETGKSKIDTFLQQIRNLNTRRTQFILDYRKLRDEINRTPTITEFLKLFSDYEIYDPR